MVVTLSLIILLVLLAVGMLSLSAVTLRSSRAGDDQATARANARLAVMQAIGQLQRVLGPDQRVSASADLLGTGLRHPHWTGAWRSTREDGKSYFVRNDLEGGLSDTRKGVDGADLNKPIEWLVSGSKSNNPDAPARSLAVTS